MNRTGSLRTSSVSKSKAKCKVCRANPVFRPGAVVCSPECSVKHVALVAAKAARIEAKKQAAADRAKLETFKSIPELKADAQVAFNAYIRARDSELPCICCEKWPQSEALSGGAWDAGHYRSRGSADHLRYNEHNVHRQLKNCNRYASGSAVEYRIGLIKRIGLPFVEALEADQKVVKWTREMLLEIKMTYRAKLKALQQ
jgi:hypothetical protein